MNFEQAPREKEDRPATPEEIKLAEEQLAKPADRLAEEEEVSLAGEIENAQFVEQARELRASQAPIIKEYYESLQKVSELENEIYKLEYLVKTAEATESDKERLAEAKEEFADLADRITQLTPQIEEIDRSYDQKPRDSRGTNA